MCAGADRNRVVEVCFRNHGRAASGPDLASTGPGQLQPFAAAPETSRVLPFARARRNGGSGVLAAAAPGRRGGRAGPAGSGSASHGLRDPISNGRSQGARHRVAPGDLERGARAVRRVRAGHAARSVNSEPAATERLAIESVAPSFKRLAGAAGRMVRARTSRGILLSLPCPRCCSPGARSRCSVYLPPLMLPTI